MTNAQRQRQLPDFERYQYGALAARLFESEKDPKYALGALEVLVGREGISLDTEDALGLFKGAYKAYEKGEKMALQEDTKNWNQKFKEKRGEYKPLELAKWYSSVLSDLSDGDKAKILGALGEHDESVASITSKYRKATRVLKDSKDEDLKDLHTEEAVAAAMKTLQKYQNIYVLMQNLDDEKFEELKPKAVRASRKKRLEGLASQL